MTTEVRAAPAAMTHEEWVAEGTRRFGADQFKWKFVCPCCRVVISVQDYKDAGAPESAVAFNCIGRYGYQDCYRAFGKNRRGIDKQPCDYTEPIAVTIGRTMAATRERIDGFQRQITERIKPLEDEREFLASRLVELGLHDPERAPGDVAIGEIQRLRGDLAAQRSEFGTRAEETAIAPAAPEISQPPPFAGNGTQRGTGAPVRDPLLFPNERRLTREERVAALRLASDGSAYGLDLGDPERRLQQLDLATHVLYTALAE